MSLKQLVSLLLTCFLLTALCQGQGVGQTEKQTGPQTGNEQKQNKSPQDEQKQKALEKNTYILLNEIAAGVPNLQLPENRIMIGIEAAKFLWEKDEPRARSLILQVTNDMAGMIGSVNGNAAEAAEDAQLAIGLRHSVLQTVIECDPKLALDFLRATRPAVNYERVSDSEADFEMQIAVEIASKSPADALSAAEESLSHGLSTNLVNVISQLLKKDNSAAAKLTDDVIQKINPNDLLSYGPAPILVTGIIDLNDPNKGKTSTADNSGSTTSQNDVSASTSLPADTIKKLTEMLIRATLKGNVPANGKSAAEGVITVNLLNWLDQRKAFLSSYSPSLFQQMENKLNQFGRANMAAYVFADEGDVSSLSTANAIIDEAPKVAVEQRDGIYKQAVLKAVREGNVDLAFQAIDSIVMPDNREHAYFILAESLIDTGKLDLADKVISDKVKKPTYHSQAVTALNDRKVLDSLKNNKIDEALSTASNMSIEQKATKLAEIARTITSSGDKERAIQILDKAWNLIPARAANQSQLRAQLDVISALAPLDTAKAGGYMKSIIVQLNDMLDAAATLNGFGVSYYKNDEVLSRSGEPLIDLVRQTAKELTAIAKLDFDLAKTLSDNFQRPEIKIMAQLLVVSNLADQGVIPVPEHKMHITM